MALAQYQDVNDSPQRSRSSSFSTPSSTSFLYQEVLNIGESALVRSYSCDHIFKTCKGGQTIQSTFIHVSSYVSPVKKISKAQPINMPQFLTVTQKKMKATKLKSNGGLRSVVDFVCTHANVPYIFFHVIVFALLINFILKNDECNKSWNITDTVSKLKGSVFGQEDAVSKMEIILNEFNRSNDSLIVALTGSTGVGKTLVSSIIYENFPWSSNEYINFFSDELEENIFSKKYSLCSANLLIIDGLHTSTAKSAISTITNLTGSLVGNQKLLIIMVFQIQSKNDVSFILENMENEKFKYYHVPFNNLNEKTVLECFKTELKRQNKSISFVDLNKLVEEQMKICPVSKIKPGCKNVFHEVSLLPDNA